MGPVDDIRAALNTTDRPAKTHPILTSYVELDPLVPAHTASDAWYRYYMPYAAPSFSTQTFFASIELVAGELGTCHVPISLLPNFNKSLLKEVKLLRVEGMNKVILMTAVNPNVRCFSAACFASGASYNLEAMGRMPELTATADQALVRASKAHTGIRRDIPVSVAREYGKRRSLTTLGDFSDLLRHLGHRIVCVQVFPFQFPCFFIAATRLCSSRVADSHAIHDAWRRGGGNTQQSRYTFGASRLGDMGDGPDEADKFPRYCRNRQRRLLAPRHQAAVTATQADLGFPSDIFRSLRDAFLAQHHLRADLGRGAV